MIPPFYDQTYMSEDVSYHQALTQSQKLLTIRGHHIWQSWQLCAIFLEVLNDILYQRRLFCWWQRFAGFFLVFY